MINMQRRIIAAPVSVLGRLHDRLAGPDDPLWPAHDWEPIRLDRPLGVGASGGHGQIKYTISAYEPGLRVRFAFPPGAPLDGYHELWVRAIDPDRAEMVHILVARPRGMMRLLWPLAARWMHQALIADLLDNAERAATGTVRRPARWSLWVRVLRTLTPPAPAEAVP
jgi:hypothetical protein